MGADSLYPYAPQNVFHLRRPWKIFLSLHTCKCSRQPVEVYCKKGNRIVQDLQLALDIRQSKLWYSRETRLYIQGSIDDGTIQLNRRPLGIFALVVEGFLSTKVFRSH